ncbi:MAG: hypothetical protein GXY19_10020 [Phycisphaerae bacterium]|nr:hypothetical protein [Phycisphaerae bacterium]
MIECWGAAVPKPRRRLYRKAQRLGQIVLLWRRVNRLWRWPSIVAFRRALRVCRRDRFEPAEAFRLGLFHPASAHDRPSCYVSRKRLTKVQEALNPAGWAPLLKNKDLFYRYSAALGIPVPRLYAVVQATAPGWSCAGGAIRTPKEWTTFFERYLPAEFAVKPAVGAYGNGFNIYRRVSGGYVDALENRIESSVLYDALVSSGHDRYVIQERVHSHSDLVRLSGTQALQTVRMITLVEPAGDVRILHAHLKVIEAEEIVDTFLDGLTGNIEAPVDLESGCLESANRIPDTGCGVVTIDVHPKTRIPFARFLLPFWPQACDLVRQTSPHFLPVRTIGWDVALTPTGPLIVEGNVWWDPPNQHGNLHTVLQTIRDLCPSVT